MLVGEIGVDRRTFLYEMSFWEIKRVVRGYGSRLAKKISNTRMLAYLITAYNGMTDLKKAGVYNIHDFYPLPWDDLAQDEQPTTEEIDALRRKLHDFNDQVSSREPDFT